MKLLKKSRFSEVFDLENGKLLKLYNGWATHEMVSYEYMANNVAFEAGIPCPRAYEVIEQGYQMGILFDFIPGVTFRQHVTAQPWNLISYGVKMADLHAKLCTVQHSELKDQQAQLKLSLEASYSILKPYWNKIMDRIESLSDVQTCLCHGDFTAENILVSSKNLFLVDWVDAYSGDPASDVARAWLAMHTPNSNDVLPIITPTLKKWLFRSYQKKYLANTGISLQRCIDWRLPTAAARLKESVNKEKEWLIRLIKNSDAIKW